MIIPVYSDQSGADRCLAALNAQDYPLERVEVILVDNASPEAITLPAGLDYPARLAHCETPGAYAARNAGVALAGNDVVALTDADCVPDRSWISEGVAALSQSEGDVLVGGEVELLLSSNPTAVELYQSLTGFMQRENIEQRGFSATANVFAWRRTLATVGPFNEDLLSGGDREWAWRAASRGIPTIHAPAAVVRTKPRTSLSGAIRQARRVAGGRRTLRQGDAVPAPEHLAPARTPWQSVAWLLGQRNLSGVERARVLAAAGTIYLAQAVETLRLRLGGSPERR